MSEVTINAEEVVVGDDMHCGRGSRGLKFAFKRQLTIAIVL